MLTFNEYQEKARATAVYPDEHKIIYPLFGLASEVGEVCGVYKRYLRGDKALDIKALAHEVGDCWWYLAVLAIDCEHDLSVMLQTDSPSEFASWSTCEYGDWSIDGLCAQLIHDLDQVVRIFRNGEHWNYEGAVWNIGRVLAAITKTYSIYTLNEVLQFNLDKLASRAERGVIKGDGDER